MQLMLYTLSFAVVHFAIADYVALIRQKRHPDIDDDYIDVKNKAVPLKLESQRRSGAYSNEDVFQALLRRPEETYDDVSKIQHMEKRYSDHEKDPFEKLKDFFDDVEKRSVDDYDSGNQKSDLINENWDGGRPFRLKNTLEKLSYIGESGSGSGNEKTGSGDAAESGSGSEELTSSRSEDNYRNLFKRSLEDVDDVTDERRKREVVEQFEGIPEKLAFNELVTRENPRVKILKRESRDRVIEDIPLPFNKIGAMEERSEINREAESERGNPIFSQLMPYKKYETLDVVKRELGEKNFQKLRIIDEEKAKSLFDDQEGRFLDSVKQDGIYYDSRTKRFLISAKADSLNNKASEAQGEIPHSIYGQITIAKDKNSEKPIFKENGTLLKRSNVGRNEKISSEVADRHQEVNNKTNANQSVSVLTMSESSSNETTSNKTYNAVDGSLNETAVNTDAKRGDVEQEKLELMKTRRDIEELFANFILHSHSRNSHRIYKRESSPHVYAVKSEELSRLQRERSVIADVDPDVDVEMGGNGMRLEEEHSVKKRETNKSASKANDVKKAGFVGIWSGLGTVPEFVPGLYKHDYITKNSTVGVKRISKRQYELIQSERRHPSKRSADETQYGRTPGNVFRRNKREYGRSGSPSSESGVKRSLLGDMNRKSPNKRHLNDRDMNKRHLNRDMNDEMDHDEDDESTEQHPDKMAFHYNLQNIKGSYDERHKIMHGDKRQNLQHKLSKREFIAREDDEFEQSESKQMEMGSLGSLNMHVRERRGTPSSMEVDLNVNKRSDDELEMQKIFNNATISYFSKPTVDGKVVFAFDEVKELMPTKRFYSKDEARLSHELLPIDNYETTTFDASSPRSKISIPHNLLEPGLVSHERQDISFPKSSFDIDKELADSMVLGEKKYSLPARPVNIEFESNDKLDLPIIDRMISHTRSDVKKEPKLIKENRKLRKTQMAQYKADEEKSKYDELLKWADTNKPADVASQSKDTEKEMQDVSDKLAESDAELEKLKPTGSRSPNERYTSDSAYLAKKLEEKENNYNESPESKEVRFKALQQKILSEQEHYRNLVLEQRKQYQNQMYNGTPTDVLPYQQNSNVQTHPLSTIQDSSFDKPTYGQRMHYYPTSQQTREPENIPETNELEKVHNIETLNKPASHLADVLATRNATNLEDYESMRAMDTMQTRLRPNQQHMAGNLIHGSQPVPLPMYNKITTTPQTIALQTPTRHMPGNMILENQKVPLEIFNKVIPTPKANEKFMHGNLIHANQPVPLEIFSKTTSIPLVSPISSSFTPSRASSTVVSEAELLTEQNTTIIPIITLTTTSTPLSKSPSTTTSTSTSSTTKSPTTTKATLSTTTSPSSPRSTTRTSTSPRSTTTNSTKHAAGTKPTYSTMLTTPYTVTKATVTKAQTLKTTSKPSEQVMLPIQSLIEAAVNISKARMSHPNNISRVKANSSLSRIVYPSGENAPPFPMDVSYQPKRTNKSLEIEPRTDGYIGCYIDHLVQGRDLPVRAGVPFVTPNNCRNACKKTGYKYAGLQYGYLCFCGNSYGKYDIVPDSECDTVCSGNDSHTCGGLWRNKIYDTENAKDEVYESPIPVYLPPRNRYQVKEQRGKTRSEIPTLPRTAIDQPTNGTTETNVEQVAVAANNAAQLDMELMLENATKNNTHDGETLVNFSYLHPQHEVGNDVQQSPVRPLKIEPGTHLFRGEIVLKQSWYDDLANPNSTKFLILTGNIEQAIKNIFANDSSFLKAEVMSLREATQRMPRKTLADFTLTFQENKTSDELTRTLFDSVLKSQKLDDMPVQPHTLRIKEYLMEPSAQAYIPRIIDGNFHLTPATLKYDDRHRLVINATNDAPQPHFDRALFNSIATNYPPMNAQPAAPIHRALTTRILPARTDGIKELNNYMSAQQRNVINLPRNVNYQLPISNPYPNNQPIRNAYFNNQPMNAFNPPNVYAQDSAPKKKKVPYVLRMFFWKDMLARKKRESEINRRKSQKAITFLSDLPQREKRSESQFANVHGEFSGRERRSENEKPSIVVNNESRSQADKWPTVYKSDAEKKKRRDVDESTLKRTKRVVLSKQQEAVELEQSPLFKHRSRRSVVKKALAGDDVIDSKLDSDKVLRRSKRFER